MFKFELDPNLYPINYPSDYYFTGKPSKPRPLKRKEKIL